MRFNEFAILAGFAAVVVNANAIPAVGPVKLEEYTKDGATFTIWGKAAADGEVVSTLHARAPIPPCDTTPNAECLGGHSARSSVCKLAIAGLTDRINSGLPKEPRSFCANKQGGKCCISWSKVIDSAVGSDLLDAANAINKSCRNNANDEVSGVVRSYLVGNTCTTVCLSNRETGCKGN